MNRQTTFIIALVSALLLHLGAGILMHYDEKSRIHEYQNEMSVINLIPESQLPPLLPETLEPESEMPAIEEIERSEMPETEDPEEQSNEAAAPEETEEEQQIENDEKEEESQTQAPEKTHQEASYQQNISKGGDILKNDILPPREEGGYSRKVTTDNDPYQTLVENAIALLEDTPFLDKEWKDDPTGDEESTYYSREFMDLLKKYNPQEPINNQREPEQDELVPEEDADLSDEDQLGNSKPATLIVHRLNPTIEIEEIAKQKELDKERAHNTNIINAAGSKIRRQEYNVSLASTKCYDTYIKGSNRKYSAIVMIFENPKGTGIYQSSGNLQLDSCIIEMTNLFIEIPAEMERIRKNAPRMGNGKGYLLNASF